MSTVLTFFKEHPSWDDGLHKILAKIPGYEAQLLPIRQAMLATCGAQINPKNGKVELIVVDLPRWNKFSEEQAAIIDKIEAINRMVVELDKIFDEAAAAGFDVPDKTVRALWNAAPRTDPSHSEVNGDFINTHGKWCNKNGIPLKSQIDPRFLAWNERAEKAMAGL